ncbi:MAG: hypothetical protein M0R03_11050 [Novosphingobium sp.]|nr:hypothetical protein [Novosphingobium sp.]
MSGKRRKQLEKTILSKFNTRSRNAFRKIKALYSSGKTDQSLDNLIVESISHKKRWLVQVK